MATTVIVLALSTATHAANLSIQADVVAVPYSTAARLVSLEVFLNATAPGTVSLAAHQLRILLDDRGAGAFIVSACSPIVHPYAGPSPSPATVVVGNRVDSGDISFSGATEVTSGAGLLKVTVMLPPQLPVGFYPLSISTDPQFTFLADGTASHFPIDIASGGLNVLSVGAAGDYDGDGNIDGNDFVKWQRSLGSPVELSSDGNGDGVTNGSDLVTWRDRFGSRRTLGDFDFNRYVDGADFVEWQRTLGSTKLVAADADADGRVEAVDLVPWTTHFGASPNRGDFDANGIVDGADFILWQRRLGSTTVLTADANRDGLTDGTDLHIWSNGFGRPSAGASARAPEPASLILALVVIVGTRRRMD